MGKAHWKYNPALDGGISLASQEDEARATHAQRSEDVVYAGDYVAIVAALRIELQRVARNLGDGAGAWVGERLSFVYRHQADAMSYQENFLTFADLYGYPALLRALARAIELETELETGQ